MNHRPIITLALLVIGASAVGAQETRVPGLNVVEYAVVPESPEFAEPFSLSLVLRLEPGTTALLGHTLQPSASMEGMGAGRIEVLDGPADSVEVRATYPVIGYRSGLQELPLLPVSLREAATATPGAPTASIASDSTMLPDSLWTMLRLGAAPIARYLPLEDSTSTRMPRPPADVLGADWSIWLLLAVGFASAAGVGGVGMKVPGWWGATGGALIARIRRRSPRHDALKELERVKSLGWHRNGRVDEFYAAFTRAWRGYAEKVDPALGTGLTSMELLASLEKKWGAARMKGLSAIVSTAEQVKFGSLAPAPEDAERDWSAVREWVRSGPAS